MQTIATSHILWSKNSILMPFGTKVRLIRLLKPAQTFRLLWQPVTLPSLLKLPINHIPRQSFDYKAGDGRGLPTGIQARPRDLTQAGTAAYCFRSLTSLWVLVQTRRNHVKERTLYMLSMCCDLPTKRLKLPFRSAFIPLILETFAFSWKHCSSSDSAMYCVWLSIAQYTEV